MVRLKVQLFLISAFQLTQSHGTINIQLYRRQYFNTGLITQQPRGCRNIDDAYAIKVVL